jgi:tetratricopeptide (TPR) repeat protein
MEKELASSAVTDAEAQHSDSLSARLTAIAKVLESDAPAASLQAGEVFTNVPGQQQALLLFAGAYRVMDELDGAQEVLQMLADAYPRLASIQYELGLVLGRLGMHRKAIECLSRVVEAEPNHPAAWRALGNQHSLDGNREAAAMAYSRQLWVGVRELKLLEDEIAESGEDLSKAENMLVQCLGVNPTDLGFVHLLAEMSMSRDKWTAARDLLERALALAPDYHAARQSFAVVMHQEAKWREAIKHFDMILEARPGDAQVELLKAWSLVLTGEYEQAQQLFDKVRPELESGAPFWLNYGHFLRTVGRSCEAVDAYRRCSGFDPAIGQAWWGLANLKTYRFSSTDIEVMQAQLQRSDLEPEQRCQMEFALATALETEKAYSASFEHYHEGNRLRRARTYYEPEASELRMRTTKAVFTPEFLRSREGLGFDAKDPIFIVGMPRAGSTLIEQILSTHPLVEGTAELPDLSEIATDLRARSEHEFPEILRELDPDEFRTLGERYLATTRYQRKQDRPYFTDKSPLNFLHVGLIHLILPNARIIDARRHPMSCSFSGYKQCFSLGSMPHTYDLSEVGRYYANYVELMAHFDKVLPGRVHRVFHESMVKDPETEIRRLLDYCGLPFEEQCLRFHENDRGVRTASSEQVRKPIYSATVEPWLNYEPWLEPLKTALGDVLTLYPTVPEFEPGNKAGPAAS